MFRLPRQVAGSLRHYGSRRIAIQRGSSPLVLRFNSTNATSSGVPPITQMNRAETSMKRFWKTVGIQERNEHFVIALDKRALKTPGGNVLEIPKNKPLAATLIAQEWENQEKLIKPYALPMTSLASRAIDGLRDESTRAGVRAALLKYLDTDTICYHEDSPKALVRLQKEHWDPLLEWAQKEFGVKINVIDSLFGEGQPAPTRRILEAVIECFDEWELAAFERAVYSTKSFILALALVKGRLTAEQAAVASHVEVASQIETWGEVEDSHDVDHRDIRRQLGSVACLTAEL
ncbi:ATP synthase complex assembly protein atp12 [Tulasnella sp. 419]|nr:ATP synthase complex assembly protein atp12 [Tulasnella sp. 419]